MIYLKDGNIPLNLAYDDDIVQEANSTYQLSFKFPLTDGKWHLLKREVFLLADDLHGEQEFFIFEVKKAKGHVQVYAKQVATLLNYYSIDSISVDRVPGQTAMTALAGSIKRNCPFTFFSDIMDRHTFNEANVSVMDALVKDKHSIVGQWGGDLVRDKYQVNLLKNGGIENESLFMYKKNLSSYEESENINNLKTRLHLKKTIQGQSEGEEDRVITVTVDSPLIGQYRQIYEADIEVNDQDVTDEASLLAYGQRYFSSTLCDLVENSIHLDVKGKADVSVKMFDTVSVFHERFDVDLRLKITSYHFGPMSKRLKSIGFGKVSQSFGSAVAGMVASSVDRATGSVVASFEQKLQKEIDNANRHFDAEFDKRVESIHDGIEQAKAEAELYADNIKQSIDADINAVTQSMQAQSEEHDRQVADILSKTQSIESLANQAKTDAASAITTALQSKDEAIADARAQVATVSQALNTAKTELQATIANNYVAKSTYDENVRGTTLKLNEIKTTADTAKQNLATYQNTVDRKLTELTTSTQTLDGKINTANAKVDTVAGQIRTELTRVEGKIPSDLGGRNYILKSDVYATSGSRYFDTSPEFIDYAYSGKYVTISLDIKGENLVPDSRGLSRIGCELRLNLSDGKVLYLQCQKIVSGTQPRERISVTKQIPQGVSVVSANKVNMYIQVGGTALAGRPKFELSSIPSDWSPAPEDINSELSSTKTLITQTASGIEQLSTSLATTDNKVTTAETNIRQLINDVSSKVSQTDYNTLTGRVDSAETAITQNAQEISKRLTSTQIESLVVGKGYATSTVVQNLVKETSDAFKKSISETKKLIPTNFDNTNLLSVSNLKNGWFDNEGILRLTTMYVSTDYIELDSNTSYIWQTWTKSSNWAGLVLFDSQKQYITGSYRSVTVDSYVKQTIESGNAKYIVFSFDKSILDGAIKSKLEKGAIATEWVPAYQDLVSTTEFHEVADTVDSHKRIISEQGQSISQVIQTANGLVTKVSALDKSDNLFSFKKSTKGFWIDGNGSVIAGETYSHSDFLKLASDGTYQLQVWNKSTDKKWISFTKYTSDKSYISGSYSSFEIEADGYKLLSFTNFDGYLIISYGSYTTDNMTGLEIQFERGLVATAYKLSTLDFATQTQVNTLAGSWAVQNLTSSGTVLNQLNLNKDGSVKIDGKLVQITGTTYIQDGVISSAKIGSLDAGKITTGTLDAARIKASSIDGSKLVFDQAFFTGLTANEAYLEQLFAKDAFITQVQAVTLSASKISGGILSATNDAMEVNLNDGQILCYTDQAALKRILTNYPTQFVKFATGKITGKGNAGVTVIGSNRWNSESSNDGGFVGIRAWNGSNIDLIDVVGDTVRLASSAFESADGWTFNTLPGKLVIDAYNNNDRPSSILNIGDIRIYRNGTTYVSLKDVLHQFNHNFKHLANITGRSDVILTWDTIK